MRSLFRILKSIITFIAMLVFLAGILITLLGCYEFVHSLLMVTDIKLVPGLIAIGLLRAVDLFLIGIVLFVFSLGMLILFNTKENHSVLVHLPLWLQVENFMELKLILWEAILTTLVVSYLAGLAHSRINGEKIAYTDLVIPGAILLISLSLYALKKSEH